MKLRKGMIVKTLGTRNYWIALNVSKQQHKSGMNCGEPGIYLFSGYWYAKGDWVGLFNKNLSHRDIGCYGKISTCNQPLKVVGYARNSFLVRKLMR